MTDWRSYKRYPIRIGHQTIALLHLFHNHGHLEDIWAWEKEDEAEYLANNGDTHAQAAAQFRKQLEGHDCVAFWMALKVEAEKVIAEHKKVCDEINRSDAASSRSNEEK